MTNEEEMDNMPIWQNHEQRITTLEVTMSGLSQKMDSVEKTIREGNDKQESKLDEINQRLFDEFFHKNRSNREFKKNVIIKLLGALVGAGGFLYAVFDLFIK